MIHRNRAQKHSNRVRIETVLDYKQDQSKGKEHENFHEETKIDLKKLGQIIEHYF